MLNLVSHVFMLLSCIIITNECVRSVIITYTALTELQHLYVCLPSNSIKLFNKTSKESAVIFLR